MRLTFHVIYVNPTDFPGLVVGRRQHVAAGGTIITDAEPFACGTTLASVREKMPPGLVCLGRHPGDDPCIAEVWI